MNIPSDELSLTDLYALRDAFDPQSKFLVRSIIGRDIIDYHNDDIHWAIHCIRNQPKPWVMDFSRSLSIFLERRSIDWPIYLRDKWFAENQSGAFAAQFLGWDVVAKWPEKPEDVFADMSKWKVATINE